MVSNSQVEEDPITILNSSDLRLRLSAVDFYDLFYLILGLWKHPTLELCDTYIKIMSLEHASAYVELISKHSDEILEWKYIEKPPIYLIHGR